MSDDNAFASFPDLAITAGTTHTLHPAPCTLHPTSHTPHPTPYTLRHAPYTLHPTPYTLHPTPYTQHPAPYTLHPTPHTLHPTPYILSPTLKTRTTSSQNWTRSTILYFRFPGWQGRIRLCQTRNGSNFRPGFGPTLRAVGRRRARHPTPHTLHPTPCTPHPAPHTLHPTPGVLGVYTFNATAFFETEGVVE